MNQKIVLWALWLGFTTYAFLFAPPDQPDTFNLITNLSTGAWQGINPLIIALFNIMGVIATAYTCLMYIDGRGQKIPAWLFATASLAVGAFAIIPYLALRQANPTFPGNKNLWLKILDSRITGIFLTIAAIILITYGVTQGDWNNFIQEWQTSRFIHVMSLDFCVLSILPFILITDDISRRPSKNSQLLNLLAFIPLFGMLIYLCVRPSLPENETMPEKLGNLSTQ
ncbi:hypothetical protein [Calothrix sp. 336/3]|uniref:hypothetical protein n=1 Tax=Calothrix sp. 336/3 TaxID=1337936 RepID=UPI0004E3996B|nr:hypothetical protein [Calothrix sp. 336/3]AKG24153.1 hypothetical protein IJ00_25065 [Calothrix sp. 336/3]